ncbi:unnamed protein product [Sphenostylis stenocarpa]|uniref:Uncharacterized protein n=1 Tax=Sphenostylis stenocarpa TaxID=92480 RepID=A0AA86SYP8_9FABA|nr:unnamed protein product [Sphenostylis stenocarpa]
MALPDTSELPCMHHDDFVMGGEKEREKSEWEVQKEHDGYKGERKARRGRKIKETIEENGKTALERGTTIPDAVKQTMHPPTKVVYKEYPDSNFVNLNPALAEPGPSTITNVLITGRPVVIQPYLLKLDAHEGL